MTTGPLCMMRTFTFKTATAGISNCAPVLLLLNRADTDFLPGFQLLLAGRVTWLSGKMKRGGIRYYINEGVTVLKKHALLTWRPFYQPQEFSSLILVSVYTPPQARRYNTWLTTKLP